jgi:hypothetical protein
MKDNYEAQCLIFVEALLCFNNHPNVIKFYAIHEKKPWSHTNYGGT